MDVKKIVIIVFVLLAVLYLVINAFSKTSQLTKMADGKVMQMIKASSLKNANNSSNFTYSMWIYVDDWNYQYGQEKTVLDRANAPTVVLGDKPNTLKVYMNYFDAAKNIAGMSSTGKPTPTAEQAAICAKAEAACAAGYSCACGTCDNGIPLGSGSDASGNSGADGRGANSATSVNTCLIENIPIQKWANVIVSLYGLTLDIYLDGKLVRTCVLPGVPQVNNNANIFVSNNKGFSGWTTTFKFWSDASNPQQAYNIYKDGFSGSILGNTLSKYRLRFSMVQDNKVKGSFEI
jgi:hypothetical protein